MDAWYRLMGGNVRAQHNGFLVVIAEMTQRAIGSRPVRSHLRARLNGRLHKRNDRFGGIILDAAQVNSSEPTRLQHLHRDNDERLAGVAFA